MSRNDTLCLPLEPTFSILLDCTTNPEVERQAEMADLSRRLEAVGAKNGALNISLMWTNTATENSDLDLYVDTPKGTITYKNKRVGFGTRVRYCRPGHASESTDAARG